MWHRNGVEPDLTDVIGRPAVVATFKAPMTGLAIVLSIDVDKLCTFEDDDG